MSLALLEQLISVYNVEEGPQFDGYCAREEDGTVQVGLVFKGTKELFFKVVGKAPENVTYGEFVDMGASTLIDIFFREGVRSVFYKGNSKKSTSIETMEDADLNETQGE